MPCVELVADDGPVLHVRDAQGKLLTAVPLATKNAFYVRLARRGNTLVVLMPKIKPREISEMTACECDRMLRAEFATRIGFLIEDVPHAKVVEVSVPITEDVIVWKCKAIAV